MEQSIIHCVECDAVLGPSVLDNVRWGIWECNDHGSPGAVFLEYELRDTPESQMRMLVMPVGMAEWLIERWNEAIAPRLAGDRSAASQ